MKAIYWSPLLLFFGSCYSYKQAATPNFEVGKFYKITTQDKKSVKMKIIEVKAESLTVSDGFKTSSIAISDIETSKTRKFSYGKTIGIPLGVAAVVTGGIILIGSNLSMGPGERLQSPP